MFEFYPFPILRNYKESKNITKLILMFVDCEGVMVVKKDRYKTTIKCSHGVIEFWSSNEYYAYAKEGEFTDSEGNNFAWMDVMPSRYAVKRLSEIDFDPFSCK